MRHANLNWTYFLIKLVISTKRMSPRKTDDKIGNKKKDTEKRKTKEQAKFTITT